MAIAGRADDSVSLLQIHARRKLPDFLQSVNLKYVKLGYHYMITHLLKLLLIPLMLGIALEVGRVGPEDLWQLWVQLQFNLVSVLLCSGVLVFVSTVYFMSRPCSIFLVDYAYYKPPDFLMVSSSFFMDHSAALIGRALIFKRRSWRDLVWEKRHTSLL